MLQALLHTAVGKAIHTLRERGVLPPDIPFIYSVTSSPRPELGDYSTNAAMSLAKSAAKNPMEVASFLKEELETHTDIFSKIEVAAPGFLNLWLKEEFLVSLLGSAVGNAERWGSSEDGAGKTVVLDYFQLNIAKRPHVGHLRSAVIGDALKRLLLASGYRAVSDTHVGDWGTQFGILLLAFREAGIDRVVIEGDPFDLLEDLYQKESQRIEEDPARRERAKGEFATLEQGDEERREIWQWMVDISMRQLEASALRLGLLPFEEHRGESVYEDAMPGIVAEALGKGVAIKKEDGAVVVDLTEEKLDEAVLIKSDGASTYLLRDLATIQYRKQQWNFFRNLYVVDVRQEHHFRQVFRVAELLGWEGIEESQHIALGRMSLPEGSMSSRKGNAISLEKVCNEARDRARAVIAEKNPELRDADAVAEAVGIGAVKYFDLSHHRKSDIVFRWEDALSFDGNTGPYLQYTHARFSSILRKLGVAEFHSVRIPGDAFLDEGERAILLVMLGFPDAVRSAIEDFAPSNLATYLHALASTANEFYHTHPIAKEADETKKSLRLALAVGVVLSLRNGLGMLGIATPEEM